MAHASVRKDNGDGTYQTETGWGDGPRVVDRGSWATRSTLTLKDDSCGGGGGDDCYCGETGFAYSPDGICFLDIAEDGTVVGGGNGAFNRWGWTIPVSADFGSASYDIFTGAGQCDITKGTLAGTLDLVDNGDGTLTATYNSGAGFTFAEFHLYVGCEILPTVADGPNAGDYTVAPGQYPVVEEVGLPGETSKSYIVDKPACGTFYVVAHTVEPTPVACEFDADGKLIGCKDNEPSCTEYGVTWADFSGMPAIGTPISGGATALVDVDLCDAKTVAIQATNISSEEFKFNGGPLAADFWQTDHSQFGDLNLTGTTSRMNTRCLDANGSPNGEMPNSYTLTWDFGDTPLDHTNTFFIGQFWRPENVLTMTAYAADGVTVVANTAFGFEWLAGISGSFTFLREVAWDANTGTLYGPELGEGPNSGYGFFSIPEGTEIGKIVFDVDDPKTTGFSDELNWGIGCFGCIQ